MKTLGKLFFAMVCITLLFACCKSYTVSWVAPTKLVDGSTITSNQDLRYNVFIDSVDDKTHGDPCPLTESPIRATSFTLPNIINCPGEHYFIGIQALTSKDGKTHESTIAWSNCAKRPFELIKSK